MAYNADQLDAYGTNEQQKNFVRLLIRDTSNNAEEEKFSDSEITAILATSANLWDAAATIADIALDQIQSRKIGELTVSYLKTHVSEWRKKAYLGSEILGSEVSIHDGRYVES